MKFQIEERVRKQIEITREDFEAYERVRQSGVTNMFATNTVCELSGLSREKVIVILGNYKALMEKFPDVREERRVI